MSGQGKHHASSGSKRNEIHNRNRPEPKPAVAQARLTVDASSQAAELIGFVA